MEIGSKDEVEQFNIPLIGFGTWRLPSNQVFECVENALKLGYRHFDCATLYNNQKDIGRVFGKYLSKDTNSQLKISRSQLFITSKVWNTDHEYNDVIKACKKTLKELQLEYLDLYLMHWPTSFKKDARAPLRRGRFLKTEYIGNVNISETWRAMEELVKKGLVRSIGISNFTISDIEVLLSTAKIKPAINQIELHPYLTQKELVAYCNEKGIKVAAYSPLGQGTTVSNKCLLADKTILEIANAIGKTAAQVLISWSLQNNYVCIVRTHQMIHMKENLEAANIQLSKEQMEAIDKLNCNFRYMFGWIQNQWD